MNVFCNRRALPVFVTVLLAMLSASAVHAVSFTAALTGSDQVPANTSTNVGKTVVNVDPSSSTISWVTTSSIPVAAAHHIHQGVAGVNGPVVVNFSAAYSGSVVNTTVAPQILANPSSFYVNLHTAAFPGGEIRGQLVADPIITPTLSTPVLVALALALAGFAAFLFRRNARR